MRTYLLALGDAVFIGILLTFASMMIVGFLTGMLYGWLGYTNVFLENMSVAAFWLIDAALISFATPIIIEYLRSLLRGSERVFLAVSTSLFAIAELWVFFSASTVAWPLGLVLVTTLILVFFWRTWAALKT